jgi:serine/threonine-protein kinase Stk1
MKDENNIFEQFTDKPLTPKNNNKVFNNRYILKNKIGEGGLCKVYDVLETYSEYFNENRNLVVKIPSKNILDKKDVAAFVYSEYSILSRLCHENIVKVTDFGIDDESQVPYLVLKKLDGVLLVNISLHQIDKQMIKKLEYSLYNAVSYLHNMQIIHADINPTNIMVSANTKASLFDFGISQNLISKESFNLSFSKMNAFNPIYAAPEILEGGTPTIQTDIFSLACVLYELYNGKLPFQKSSLELKETPLQRKDFVKIPLLQKYWFKKALIYDSEKRVQTIPISIKIRIFLNRLRNK